jgi:hypothetical protein
MNVENVFPNFAFACHLFALHWIFGSSRYSADVCHDLETKDCVPATQHDTGGTIVPWPHCKDDSYFRLLSSDLKCNSLTEIFQGNLRKG